MSTDRNPKRRIAPATPWGEDERRSLEDRARYNGSPLHKLHPGDYGLTPPAAPRRNKTLCDAEGPFPKRKAEELLRTGIRNGMVSLQTRNGWPQNIWAVDGGGQAYEAELENEELGTYHGYPTTEDDDLRGAVLHEWKKRQL